MPQCRADPVGRGTVESGQGVSATPPREPPVVRRGTGGGWGGNDGGPLTERDGLPVPTAKLGLWVFMGVVTVLFTIIVSTYVTRMGFADWRPLPEPRLLWLNTGVLILSSVAMQWAQVAARRGRIGSLRVGLLAGGVFAWAFLAGQLWAWQQLGASGYFLAVNPANTFFYLITALHGLHLCGGLAAWGKTTVKVWRGLEVRLSVELCAVYWHFLLVVWLGLFVLMLTH
ncbi:MAG: cytochrome c oxidase subunit 3 [Gammaproteobacteria bacterium]